MLLYSKTYWVCLQLFIHSVSNCALLTCNIMPKAAIREQLKHTISINNSSVPNFACCFLTPVCNSLAGTGERYKSTKTFHQLSVYWHSSVAFGPTRKQLCYVLKPKINSISNAVISLMKSQCPSLIGKLPRGQSER